MVFFENENFYVDQNIQLKKWKKKKKTQKI